MRLKDYEALVKGRKCVSCGYVLPAKIGCYPHGQGWTVEGMPGKWWLYARCPKCGYDSALWKLGIPREKEETQTTAKEVK